MMREGCEEINTVQVGWAGNGKPQLASSFLGIIIKHLVGVAITEQQQGIRMLFLQVLVRGGSLALL